MVDELCCGFHQFEIVKPPVRYAATVEGDDAAFVIYQGEFPDHGIVAALPGSLVLHGYCPSVCQSVATCNGCRLRQPAALVLADTDRIGDSGHRGILSSGTRGLSHNPPRAACSQLQRLHKHVQFSTGMNAGVRIQNRCRSIPVLAIHVFSRHFDTHAGFLQGVSPIPGQASILSSLIRALALILI